MTNRTKQEGRMHMRIFGDINWTLYQINNYLSESGQRISKFVLQEQANRRLIYGKVVQISDVINIGQQLGLINVDKYERIIITKIGEEFLSKRKKINYELSIEQKEFLAPIYIPYKYQEIREIIELFKYNEGQYKCSKNLILKKMNKLVENMIYLEILIDTQDELILSNSYLAIYLLSTKQITKNELDIELKRKKVIGDKGEKLALEYEKERLYRLGLTEQAEKVKVVSNEFVNLGFDILSFSSKDTRYNRFIEVKVVNESEGFYWSINEKQIASFLGEKYFLYLVRDIGNVNSIKEISNPAVKLNKLGYKERATQFELSKHI